MKPCRYCMSTQHYPYKCLFRPTKDSKPCSHCESKDHLSWQCFQNPKRKIQTRAKLKNGKQHMKWAATRKQWFEQNKADYYTYYICGRSLTREQTTLDHVKARSRHPELRHDMDNLKPACWDCNQEKGSKDIEELRAYD